MNRQDETNQAPGQRGASLENLLAYREALDPVAFTHLVTRRTTRRKHARVAILAGAAALSAAVVAAIVPEQFTFLHEFGLSFHHASHAVAMPSIAGLALMSFVLILIAGTSKTIDSI
jgi:hypothetical protein